MANPRLENGHFGFPNELAEQLAKINLSAYEWRVIMVVLRKTWGWNKKFDFIPLSQIVKISELRKQHASRTKFSLLKKNIFICHKGMIGFNKDYEQWTIKTNNVTDSGYKSVTNRGDGVTDSGYSVTNSGYKSSPIQGTSKEIKETYSKERIESLSRFADCFLAYWNSKSNLPQIRVMTAERKHKFSNRMKEQVFAENWQAIIDKISDSKFCTGYNDRGWRADIDWLLSNSTNYVKVLEGKYDDSSCKKSVAPLQIGPDGDTPRERLLKQIEQEEKNDKAKQTTM